jgi:hypothetical protein
MHVYFYTHVDSPVCLVLILPMACDVFEKHAVHDRNRLPNTIAPFLHFLNCLHERDRLPQGLTEAEVFGFGRAEGNLCLQLALSQDGTPQVGYNIA